MWSLTDAQVILTDRESYQTHAEFHATVQWCAQYTDPLGWLVSEKVPQRRQCLHQAERVGTCPEAQRLQKCQETVAHGVRPAMG